MVSVVIRNKNEAKALADTLEVLTKVYVKDIDEIILVDNKSQDNSIEVAKQFNCKIITITDFTYGKAINLGIEKARNNNVLLLSAHAIPVGQSFFKNAVLTINKSENIAGLRFINSYTNYKRALNNDFKIKDGINYGLMAACAMINKRVWNTFKFDESLLFSEDKEWSQRVLKENFEIIDCNETFFYHIKRDENSLLNRFKNETIAHYQLHNLKYPSVLKIVLIFIKRIVLDLPKWYFKKLLYEIKVFKIKLKINKTL